MDNSATTKSFRYMYVKMLQKSSNTICNSHEALLY